MTLNMFNVPEGRHDPAHWTRTNVGFTSPLWWPFLMAAGAGAAWWTYTNWSRIAASSWTGDLQRLGGGSGSDASGASSLQSPGWSLDQNLAVQGDGASETEDDDLEDDEGVDDGSDAIDAAYAANLGPVPAPRKRAPARKSTGGGAAKRSAPKAAAKQPAKKAAPRKTAARKSATKKTPAKRGR